MIVRNMTQTALPGSSTANPEWRQAVDRDLATLIAMDRALGDWVVVLTPATKEIAALAALIEQTQRYEVVFGTAAGGPTPRGLYDAAGELFWGGVAGTQWWISPKAGVAGLIMTQRQMAFTHPFAVEFKRLAYEAVKRGS